MLSGGSPCPVVEHTNTTRGSEIKSAFFPPPEETQKHRSSACVWCHGGRRLPLPASTHHIVGVQGRHPHLQPPPLGLAPDPLGRVLGRARLAAVQHQKAWQRHDGWLGGEKVKGHDVPNSALLFNFWSLQWGFILDQWFSTAGVSGPTLLFSSS